MWKHIDWLERFDLIGFMQQREVAGLGRGVTADIHDPGRANAQQCFDQKPGYRNKGYAG